MLRVSFILGAVVLTAVAASAQPAASGSSSDAPISRPSIAVEADVLAYGLPGYSAIVNVSMPSGLQAAFGIGRYEVPGFLLKGDDHYDAVGWTATATSVQVFRVTYRFRGPLKSGPALGAVVLNQHWRLRANRLSGETTFRPLSVGLTGGYYVHMGPHFYIYPTAAYTYNHVYSGSTTLNGVPYTVEKFGPNASLHAGWEWGI